MGAAYIFVRWKNPVAGVDVGHVGWGFEMDGQFCCGGTENVKGDLVIPPGKPNNAWLKVVNMEQDMLEEMRQDHFAQGNRYDAYKCVSIQNPNIDGALSEARANKNKGFIGVGNNCLDHACSVLEKYGVPWHDHQGKPAWGMPWKQTNPKPNDWFNAWKVTGPHNL